MGKGWGRPRCAPRERERPSQAQECIGATRVIVLGGLRVVTYEHCSNIHKCFFAQCYSSLFVLQQWLHGDFVGSAPTSTLSRHARNGRDWGVMWGAHHRRQGWSATETALPSMGVEQKSQVKPSPQVTRTSSHARGCVVVASSPEVERVSGSTSSARVLFMQLRHRLDAPEGADGLA
jgi:hypothetical protein